MSFSLEAIWIYPLKSCGKIELETSETFQRGLAFDRRWMLTDQNFQFLTQRQQHKMAKIQIRSSCPESWEIHAPGMANLIVSKSLHLKKTAVVNIWKDSFQACLVSEACDAWFSEFLGFPCHLVYMDTDNVREVEKRDNVPQGTEVSFADGYPLLLISQASLDDLNQRLDVPVTMDRFRPNLIVNGTQPFEEDTWKQIAIGDCVFDVVKPCKRCVLTTVDPQTAEKDTQGEPLKTLSTYRKQGNGVYFGQNLIVKKPGILKRGDKLTIIQHNEPS